MTTEVDGRPADAYETFFGPAIFAPLAERLVPVAAPQPGEHTLDLACGTGIVARRLAAAVGPTGQVVGVDVNPQMLQVASEVVPGDAPIRWVEADAGALDVAGDLVDLVTCQQGLQFFPDRTAALAEVRRVLRPDGRFVAAVWRGFEHHPLYRALAEVEQPELTALGVPVTWSDLEAPFSLSDPDELRGLLAATGFGDIEVAEVTIEARFATPDRFVERMERAYAAVVPAFVADPAQFDAFVARVVDATRDLVAAHRVGDHVVVPMHAHLASATA